AEVRGIGVTTHEVVMNLEPGGAGRAEIDPAGIRRVRMLCRRGYIGLCLRRGQQGAGKRTNPFHKPLKMHLHHPLRKKIEYRLRLISCYANNYFRQHRSMRIVRNPPEFRDEATGMESTDTDVGVQG